jgi:hypothetical protein
MNGKILTITHREYVQRVYAAPDPGGSSDITWNLSGIYPTNARIFPWLSTIAGSYETYNFKKLHFEYFPTCPSTTAGSVFLAVDYDASDNEPNLDDQKIMTMDASVTASAWKSIVHKSSLANLNKRKTYYTSGIPSLEGDSRSVSVGNVIIANDAQTSNLLLGKVYVEYVIELRTPQPLNPLSKSLFFANVSTAGTLLNPGTGTNGHVRWENSGSGQESDAIFIDEPFKGVVCFCYRLTNVGDIQNYTVSDSMGACRLFRVASTSDTSRVMDILLISSSQSFRIQINRIGQPRGTEMFAIPGDPGWLNVVLNGTLAFTDLVPAKAANLDYRIFPAIYGFSASGKFPA